MSNICCQEGYTKAVCFAAEVEDVNILFIYCEPVLALLFLIYCWFFLPPFSSTFFLI